MNQQKGLYQSDIPPEAKFVTYLYPNSKTTVQQTLCDEGENHPHKIPRTWKDIVVNTTAQWAYAVQLKDSEYKISPYLYLIKVQGTVKDIMDIFDAIEADGGYNMSADFEQSIASEALSGTGLRHYVMVQVGDNEENLMPVAFDHKSMMIVRTES